MDTDWLKHLVRLYLPVYRCESETMKVAYAGYSSIKKNYFIRQLLNSNNQPTSAGRKFYWQIPDLIKSSNLDIVVSEISPKVLSYFRNLDGYIVPEWVKMRINIDRPMSEICHRSVSDFSDVTRKIRKYNLTYELHYDKESVESFYDKFYLPYMTKRHGEEAWIEDISIIREASLTSFIIAIREDGVTVGSCLVRKTPEALFLTRLGLLDGNEEYRRHGVIGAIYYYCIIEGQKLGCHYLEVGGTRPFITDGLTKYKSGLGAEFVSNLNHYNEYLWIGVNEHSAVAQEYIKNNPVIYIKKDFDLMRSGT
jgi:hypothetical protein